MKVIVQRSKKSSVSVKNKEVGSIQKGLVLLVGFTHDDNSKDIDYLVDKIINLRIFDDENHVMNKSLLDVNGEILSISQFTLYSNPYEGRRPSYKDAAPGLIANKLYEEFNSKLREKNILVSTGLFGEDMLVNIENDGPVTIIIESRK